MARPRKRRRAGRGRFVDRPIAYALEAALALGLLYTFGQSFYTFAQTSPTFGVRNIQAVGLERLAIDDVVAASGITTGDNLLFLDKEAIRQRVESMPYVKTCGLRVSFPDLVVLDVAERKPFASLMVHSRSYEIDEEGIVLREYTATEMPLGPFITSVGGLEFVNVGDRVGLPALKAAIALWKSFGESPLAGEFEVSEIAAIHEDDLRMYGAAVPFEVRWGRAEFADQVRRLEILWENKGGELGCNEFLDLRFGEGLVCR